MESEIELRIQRSRRTLGLLWVLLLSFRYRGATPEEIATLQDICGRLERGVPRCQEYNEAIRHALSEVREICGADVPLPPRAKVERLAEEIDRLSSLLQEYLPVVTDAALTR